MQRRRGGRDRFVCLGLFMFLMAAPGVAHAQREDLIVRSCTQVARELVNDPYRGIPRDVLRQSQGVIIIPNMLQAGFVFGARVGRGIVMVRDANGSWSHPFFIRMTGGSFGLQAGVNSNEMMLVFRDRRTIDRFLMGRDKLTFGVDASYAVGPTGSGVGANTDPAFQADIFVYSRGRGLYAGAVIGGAIARVDNRANWTFYGLDASASEIVENIEGLIVPESAEDLKGLLIAASASDAEKPRDRPARPREEDPVLDPIPGFEPGFGRD